MRARLIAAATRNDCDEAMKVLPFGGDLNSIDPSTGQTVLMMAAGRGYVEFVRTLLDFCADPNAVDRRAGAAALHKACQGGHIDVAKMLVEAGAFIDLQATTTGHSPLIEAIWYKSDDIVEYLLDRNARIELTTYYGFTIDDHVNYALKVSKAQSDKEKLARIKDLIQRRRERDQAARESAVLIQAALRKNVNALTDALRDGARTEERYPIIGGFEDGHTALLVAARDDQADMVRELLNAGADVNAVEPVFGAVPLHKATYNGHLAITRLLTDAPGVNLNYQGPSNGYTPLQDALWHGFADCAKQLLDAGACTDIIAYDGKRAVDLAEEKLGKDHPLTQRLRSQDKCDS